MKGKKWFANKFEFEIEIIVRPAWSNVKFIPHPVSVVYEDDHITHFRPLQDFTRISIMHTVMITAALLFFLPRLFILNFSIRGIWNKLKTEFAKNKNETSKIALSVGVGFFFGVFPAWGFQMLIAVALAELFRTEQTDSISL